MTEKFQKIRESLLGRDLYRECKQREDNLALYRTQLHELNKKPSLTPEEQQQKNQLIVNINTIINTRVESGVVQELYSKKGLIEKPETRYDSRISEADFLCDLSLGHLDNMHGITAITRMKNRYDFNNYREAILNQQKHRECYDRSKVKNPIEYKDLIPSINPSYNDISENDLLALCNIRSIEDAKVPINIKSRYPDLESKNIFNRYEATVLELRYTFNQNVELREKLISCIKSLIDREVSKYKEVIRRVSNDDNMPISSEGFFENLSYYISYIPFLGKKRKASSPIINPESSNKRQQLIDAITNITELKKFLSLPYLTPSFFNSLRGEYKADISSGISIVNPSWTFFSAYPDDLTKEEFSDKKVIWLTPEISQSLLFITGDKRTTQPVIFKFNFKEPLVLINPGEKENKSFVKRLLNPDGSSDTKTNNMIKLINNILGEMTGEKNDKLLAFAEVINNFINDENYKIDGYRNRYDQNEIALLDFKENVKKESVVKGYFLRVDISGVYNQTLGRYIDGVRIPYPFSPKQSLGEKYVTDVSYGYTKDNFDTWYDTDNSINSRAYCPYNNTETLSKKDKLAIRVNKPVNYNIIYKWENEPYNETFNCMISPKDSEIIPMFQNYV